MEQTKLHLPLTSQKFDTFEVAQWQWQSDLDPFKETDPTKWTWQSYSNDENLIIEEAFFLNQDIAHLLDYEIDLKKMLQVHKKSKSSVRRVRRQEPSRFMMEVPEANVIVKDQKTMNEAFGTVQHFLEYIMKRTPEAYTLYQRLKAFSLDSERADFEDLVHQVVVCIEKGAGARAKIIKTRTACDRAPNYILEARKMIDMINNNSTTLRHFLKAILKIYSMETFVCYWLNDLLRAEEFEEINVLTPYLVCLVYTFKLSDYVLKDQSSQEAINDKLGFVVKHRLYLYRGSALTEEQLVSYNPNKIKYFSWNGVSSTTRDRNIARSFMHRSLTKKINEGKIGVIFFIEIDFDSLEDYHGLIDISKDSKYPKEQEVILAPGTVFQLLEISLIENQVYEIRLRVTKIVKKVHEDIALLGVLQNRTISREKGLIEELPKQIGFKMLELLRGNKLIRKMEISNSGIEEHIMQEIENVRLTTHVKKEDIRLVGNTIVVSSLSHLAHYFSLSNLSEILASNKVRFASEIGEINSPKLQIKNLIFKDKTIEMFRNNIQLSNLWNVLKNEKKILGLSFLIQKVQFSDDELTTFFECIKNWKSLENLALALNKSHVNSIQPLYQALSSSITLNQLSLKFPFTDKEVGLLQNALRPLKSLQTLSLDWQSESRISDVGLVSLKKAIFYLESLQHLSLRFGGENKISDEGLNHLKSAISSFAFLQYLSLEFVGCSFSGEWLDDLTGKTTSLQHLHLGFRSCNHLSCERLKSLKNALKLSPNLRHLCLDFAYCSLISDESLNYLVVPSEFLISLKSFRMSVQFCLQNSNYLNSALVSLTSLHRASLDLKFCKPITMKSLDNFQRTLAPFFFVSDLSIDFLDCNKLARQELSVLLDVLSLFKSLRSLSLDLTDCGQMSDPELSHLNSVLKCIISLQHLCLNFGHHNQFSNGWLGSLSSALISLTSLQYLSLNFGYSEHTSCEGLFHLGSALASIVSLHHLSLVIRPFWFTVDEGLFHLSSALASLISLQHLSLNFYYCPKVSNKWFNHLSSALKALTFLKHLSLDFGGCSQVSDEGLNSLSNALTLHPSLQHFSFEVSGRNRISDKGLNYLKNALASFISLQYFSLSFKHSSSISNEGLHHISNALMELTSLQHLSLNFEHCEQISDEGLIHLSHPLKLLTLLQHLSLNFEYCKQISEEGLIHLSDALTLHTSLQHLSLIFWDCQILDKGLSRLSSVLASFTALQHLSLNFGSGSHQPQPISLSSPSYKPEALHIRGCTRISDIGLKNLNTALTSLTSLQHLSLQFCHCKSISNEGLESLNSVLTSCISIQSLSLNFSGCNVSNDGLINLSGALTFPTFLQHLHLRFEFCEQISNEGVNHLKSSLKFLSYLKNPHLNFSRCQEPSSVEDLDDLD